MLIEALDWFASFAEPTHIHTNILLRLAHHRIWHTSAFIILSDPRGLVSITTHCILFFIWTLSLLHTSLWPWVHVALFSETKWHARSARISGFCIRELWIIIHLPQHCIRLNVSALTKAILVHDTVLLPLSLAGGEGLTSDWFSAADLLILAIFWEISSTTRPADIS